MNNQDLYCLHPNIVRSRLKSLKEIDTKDLDLIKLSEILVEADLNWNIKVLRGNSIFPSILCKYHNDLSRVNGKHPFSWAMSEIVNHWPLIIDFLRSHSQSDAQLMFLKEFILDLFTNERDHESIQGIYAIQYDMIDLICDLSKDKRVGIIHDVLEILPKKPLCKYFSIGLKLIKVANGNGQFELLLDHLITRFEMGFPILESCLIIKNWDFNQVSWKSEILLVFISALVLSNCLDREICCVWVSILDSFKKRIEARKIHNVLIVLKKMLVWPLLKIKIEKTFENEGLLEWAYSGIGQDYSHERIEFEFYTRDFGDVIFNMIGPILELHSVGEYDLKAFYFPKRAYLSTVILSSLVFHSNQSIQYSALDLLALSKPYSLAKFSFLLYSCNRLSQDIQLYLFSHVIPTMISKSKDPFMAVSVINSVFLIEDTASRILSMYHIWDKYPKIWPKLRSILGETMQKWKLALIKDSKIETALSWSIRSCCAHQSENTEDLVALILNGLSSLYFSDESYADFLFGLNLCIRDDVIDLRAVWNVTIQPFMTRFENGLPDIILIEIIRFFGLVGQSSNVTEDFEEFRHDILNNHLLSSLNHNSLEIQLIVSESLSAFPIESILNSISPIRSYPYSGKDLVLLKWLITAEASNMRRGLFMGDRIAGQERDLNEEEKKVINFKKSIMTSVRNEIAAGRMNATRKSALCFLSAVDCPFTVAKDMSAIKEIVMLVKNMNMDSIWQLLNICEFLENFWSYYLCKLYENFKGSNHLEKISQIEDIISFTYSSVFKEKIANSSTPQTASNLLCCIGSLISSAFKLGILDAYNLAIKCFDALNNHLKLNSSPFIPEDFKTSRDLQISILVVMADLTTIFNSHDINRKVEFIELMLESDFGSDMKSSIIWHLIPKTLSEIAIKEGLSKRLFALWSSLISKLKTRNAESSPWTNSFFRSFRDNISNSLIESSQMSEVLEIGKQTVGVNWKDLQTDKLEEYLENPCLEKGSDEYLYTMSNILQSGISKAFESVCNIIQETLRSPRSNTAEKINALLLISDSCRRNLLILGKKFEFCQLLVEIISTLSDPKVLRVSSWVLAKLFISLSSRPSYLGDQSSIEPKDFSRLDEDHSIIRFIFDKLCCTKSINDSVFLESLLNVNSPLPRVDWTRMLEHVSKNIPELDVMVFKFAAKHSVLSESSSMSSYFSKNFILIGMQNSSFITSMNGIGNFLQLAGFSKSKDFLLSPSISHSECIENVKKLLKAVFYGSNTKDKITLSESLKICLKDWTYPELLGKELILQITAFFTDWLGKCSNDISADEILIIRNFGLICSNSQTLCAEQSKVKLNPPWIWFSFLHLHDIKFLVSIFQDCLASDSLKIISVGGNALKTHLVSLSKESLETWLVYILDAMICIPIDQVNSVVNMWNLGVLSILHSYMNYPAYSFENESILGWGNDEIVFHGKEILWDWSNESIDLSQETRAKVTVRIRTLNDLFDLLKRDLNRFFL